MIIAGATIGAVSFGIQVYNSWRNEKNAKAIQASQEAYQRAAMEQNFQVAMEQFRAMSEARKQIIGERTSRENCTDARDAPAEPENDCRTVIIGQMASCCYASGDA